MDRRTLLKLSVAAAVPTLNATAAHAAGEAGTAAAGAAAVTVPPFELAGMGVAELAAALHSGARTSVSLCELYLRRMDEVDVQGPALHAIIERNPDALALAAALDRERREKGPRGPLHGIPVVLKDNIDTADRMRTSAGSLALADSIAPRDAHVTARLRDAGCVILGKTNLSEWANFRGARSTSGWSGRGGQTRHPYALDRNTSGSSSGSASAAAADLCALAVGTETDGSIVSPASICGLVGVKPTVGLVSRAGIVPIAHSQDTAGPMTRTVADAAALLTAMTGVDPRDPATTASRGKARDYTRFLDPDGLKGARIGVARDLFGTNDHVDALIEAQVAVLRDAGAVIVDPVRIANFDKLGASEYEVLLYEFKADLDAYLAALGPQAPVHSLADVIAFNERNAARELQYFGQERMQAAQKKGPLTDDAYRKALTRNRRLARTEGIDATLAKHKLDALVGPTGSPAWLTDYVNGDHADGGASQFPAVAGYPHITVPAGLVWGLPVGLSFFAGAWSEPVLFRLAYAYEQKTKARVAPKFLATAPVA
ncbi:MAG: amidase [Burkholderiales bacterium]